MTYLVDGYKLTRCRTIQTVQRDTSTDDYTTRGGTRKKSPKWNCIQWKRFLGRRGGPKARFRDETGDIFGLSLSPSLAVRRFEKSYPWRDGVWACTHGTPIRPLSYFSLSSCGWRNVNSCDRCGLHHESSIVRTHWFLVLSLLKYMSAKALNSLSTGIYKYLQL